VGGLFYAGIREEGKEREKSSYISFLSGNSLKSMKVNYFCLVGEIK